MTYIPPSSPMPYTPTDENFVLAIGADANARILAFDSNFVENDGGAGESYTVSLNQVTHPYNTNQNVQLSVDDLENQVSQSPAQPVTYTLPSPSNAGVPNGKKFSVKNYNPVAMTLTGQSAGQTSTIDNQTLVTIPPNASYTVVFDGSGNWIIV